VKFLKYGNTLDNIPVPAEFEEELPPVETAPVLENEPQEEGEAEKE